MLPGWIVIADQERRIGLFAATGVGVGAIVGGGILALAGVAFATTGPAAIIAFAVNGIIALLTALSFAEMASKFPESGGTYTFSRKVLSVEAAFTVGWVVWFASIVAAVLYALGFGHFALIFTRDLMVVAGFDQPEWLNHPWMVAGIALGSTAFLSVSLMLKSAGGGQWANVAKVLVFLIVIVGGLWAVSQQAAGDTGQALQPFFTAGFGGLIQAMGYSFIALQGFDLIAAVGGEVRNPAKTIPRAMMLSLFIALLIYIPLLFVITSVGTEGGQPIAEAAANNPEGIVAEAANHFLGPTGYWLVVVAALLSMFTALQANLFAASRIAFAMSRDRTLPSILSKVSVRGVPVTSVLITGVLVSVLVVMVPDVAAAGAASSLIFLVTFAIAHWLSVLVRERSKRSPPPFRTPFFPAVPVIGGLACIGLAIFQGIAVPSAGSIAAAWIGIGGLLFLTLFARRARLMDVTSLAADPELARMRGNTPLVLVPIANPQNAEAMITLADTLVPSDIGRVLLQTVVVTPPNWDPETQPEPVDRSQTVLRELLRASNKLGVHAETLTTVSTEPMQEIARVAKLHRCESVLLGLSEISEDSQSSPLEGLLGQLETDVVVLRANENWQFADANRILVPVAGRGGHDHLLARLLGSLTRRQSREVIFVRVVPEKSSVKTVRRVQRELDRMARDNMAGKSRRLVIQSDDAVAAITAEAESSGLVILGVQRIGPREKLFGSFTRQIAKSTSCPVIVMSRRG
ncbi:MAG: amino acid permease [Rubripirellula sp.]